MRVATALFCDRAYRTVDGRVLAAGILPGLVLLRAGETATVDAVVQLAGEAGRCRFSVRITVGGTLLMQKRMEARLAPPALAGVEVHGIPVAHGNGPLRLEVRRRNAAEWALAAELAVGELLEAPTPEGLREGPLSS